MVGPADRDETRRILDRTARESEALGTSALSRTARRLGDHFAGHDAIGGAEDGSTDRVELWARRTGRALSVPFALLLIWWLGVQLGWWATP